MRAAWIILAAGVLSFGQTTTKKGTTPTPPSKRRNVSRGTLPIGAFQRQVFVEHLRAQPKEELNPPDIIRPAWVCRHLFELYIDGIPSTGCSDSRSIVDPSGTLRIHRP